METRFLSILVTWHYFYIIPKGTNDDQTVVTLVDENKEESVPTSV